jgi:hypothetical protein
MSRTSSQLDHIRSSLHEVAAAWLDLNKCINFSYSDIGRAGTHIRAIIPIFLVRVMWLFKKQFSNTLATVYRCSSLYHIISLHSVVTLSGFCRRYGVHCRLLLEMSRVNKHHTFTLHYDYPECSTYPPLVHPSTPYCNGTPQKHHRWFLLRESWHHYDQVIYLHLS